MSRITVQETGLIHRNPKPHLRSEHAYFPSVVQMRNGELLCSLVWPHQFKRANPEWATGPFSISCTVP